MGSTESTAKWVVLGDGVWSMGICKLPGIVEVVEVE